VVEKQDGPELKDDRKLQDAVVRAHERQKHWLRTGEWPLGHALAMMGKFGWTIVAPILLGAFVGRWLDRTFDTGVFWSASMVMLGAAAGFWIVWGNLRANDNSDS
jgi:ATP synthase protein I